MTMGRMPLCVSFSSAYDKDLRSVQSRQLTSAVENTSWTSVLLFSTSHAWTSSLGWEKNGETTLEHQHPGLDLITRWSYAMTWTKTFYYADLSMKKNNYNMQWNVFMIPKTGNSRKGVCDGNPKARFSPQCMVWVTGQLETGGVSCLVHSRACLQARSRQDYPQCMQWGRVVASRCEGGVERGWKCQ